MRHNTGESLQQTDSVKLLKTALQKSRKQMTQKTGSLKKKKKRPEKEICVSHSFQIPGLEYKLNDY